MRRSWQLIRSDRSVSKPEETQKLRDVMRLDERKDSERMTLESIAVDAATGDEDFDVENEATLIAWFVDLFRRCLDEEPFRKELGSFLGFNLAMLQEVETRLIESIHAQIKDYIQMEELREKDKQKFKETVPKFPNDVSFGPPPPEGSVVEQLQLLMFGCEQARKFIAEARNCER
ncbi:hypothetical protein COOONC_10170 [Cooperia oncophora]